MPVDQIAKHLGVSEDTICTLVAKKSMCGHRVGRFWKLKALAVDDWVRAGGIALENASYNDEGY